MSRESWAEIPQATLDMFFFAGSLAGALAAVALDQLGAPLWILFVAIAILGGVAFMKTRRAYLERQGTRGEP